MWKWSWLLLALTLATGNARAEKITIIVGGLDRQINMPATLAQKLGFFTEQGLDVELISTPAGVEAENELLAGSVQAVVGFYDHTIDLQSKGKTLTNIVQFLRVPGEAEMVPAAAEDVKSMADLKGKTLGVTGLGSSTDFLTRALAARAGLKPGEYTRISVGAGNSFIAALKQGHIEAGMTTEPTIGVLQSTGAGRILIDLRTPESTQAALGGLYPASGLTVVASWLATHEETAQKLANAFVKTMHWIAVHDAATIADTLPRDYWAGDKALYVKELAAGKSMFTPDGKMPDGGPELVLQVMKAALPDLGAKTINLGKTYTTKYVDRADAS
jgi:NitT/TauT family transport system substrate-binding protein